MSRTFDPQADGRTFRLETLDALSDRYSRHVAAALDILGNLDFEFAEMAEVHASQLRPNLIFRHALPFCIAEEAFFGLDGGSARVLAVLLAGHSLALSQLDYHLDGAPPDPAATGATAHKVDMAAAVAYAVRIVYAAGRLADELPGGGRLFRDVFDPVSGFVVLRMHRDHTERYCEELLDTAHRDLDEYLTSDNSRLRASGYWEVMVRGPFAGRAVTPPDELISVVQRLRTLRQAVDEIADFQEDICAGLITTPLLFALAGNPDHDRTRGLVRRLWRCRNTPPGTADEQLLAEITSEVTAAGGFDKAARHADAIWKDGTRLSESGLGSRAHGFITLLDLKRAKLAELLAARAS